MIPYFRAIFEGERGIWLKAVRFRDGSVRQRTQRGAASDERSGVLQIRGVESFAEPAIDVREHRRGARVPTMLALVTDPAHRRSSDLAF
jgi:hypothetical protein